MAKAKTFQVTYDAEADVLYITQRSAAAARGVEDEFGIVWRFGEDDEILGATVVDFADRWIGDQTSLASHLSRRFGISALQASGLVARAVDDRRNAS
jgi:uncharacterized protein YuzE